MKEDLLGSRVKGNKTDRNLDQEGQTTFLNGEMRAQSVCLMLAGSFLGFCGFSFAAYLGLWHPGGKMLYNIEGRHFEDPAAGLSGLPYYPETVSELVSDPDQPAGKAFFAFVLGGALCILISWYPWRLRNVYVGDDTWSHGEWGVKGLFLNLRSLLPPMGMTVVACIRVIPRPWRTSADNMACNLHTLGAVSAIGGFCGLEFLTLTLYLNKVDLRSRRLPASIAGLQWGIRMGLTMACLFCIICFQAGGFFYNKITWPHPDHWIMINETLVQSAKDNGKWDVAIADRILEGKGLPGLYDTATGSALFFKKMEFWGEVGAGLFMIVSHWVIWYFCEERWIDLNEKMPDFDTTDGETPAGRHGAGHGAGRSCC